MRKAQGESAMASQAQQLDGRLATRASARPPATLETIHEALGALAERYRTDEVLTAVKLIPAREAIFRPMPEWVRPELAEAYRGRGIDQLYSNQAEAA